MNQIEITQIAKQPTGYIEISYKMQFSVPTTLQNITGGTLSNAQAIIESYGYNLENHLIVKYDTKSLPTNSNVTAVKNLLIQNYNTIATSIAAFQPKVYDTLTGSYFDGTNWNLPA